MKLKLKKYEIKIQDRDRCLSKWQIFLFVFL